MRATTVSEFGTELRTVAIIWRRELTRFFRAKAGIVTGMMQPILFLFVLGVGIKPLVGDEGGLDFTQFLFPGIVGMSVMTTAIFSSVSIVIDRKFGFLREMLVAPVSHAAIVLGKTLGGATVSALQGSLIFIFAPLVGLHLTVLVVVQMVMISLLLGLAMTSFGVFVASGMKRIEDFQAVSQFLMLPMILLSGAMFPLHGIATWLDVLTKLNPLTYAIDPLRRVLLDSQGLSGEAFDRYGTGVMLFGTRLSILQEIGITALFTLLFLALSIRTIGRKAE